jgi:hypothetical protein
MAPLGTAIHGRRMHGVASLAQQFHRRLPNPAALERAMNKYKIRHSSLACVILNITVLLPQRLAHMG